MKPNPTGLNGDKNGEYENKDGIRNPFYLLFDMPYGTCRTANYLLVTH